MYRTYLGDLCVVLPLCMHLITPQRPTDVYRLMVALGKDDEAREIKQRFGGFKGLRLRREGGYADVEKQFQQE